MPNQTETESADLPGHMCAVNNRGQTEEYPHTNSSYWRDGSLQFPVLHEAPGRGRRRKDASAPGRKSKASRDRLIAPDGTAPAEIRSHEDDVHFEGGTASHLNLQDTLLEVADGGPLVRKTSWGYQRTLFLKLAFQAPQPAFFKATNTINER